jgi:hypothetical protein
MRDEQSLQAEEARGIDRAAVEAQQRAIAAGPPGVSS